MKRTTLFVSMLVICLGITALAYAASTANVSVTASVPNAAPDMTIQVKELTTANQNPFTGTDVTSMSFGQLTNLLATGGNAGLWYSTKYYCVIIYTNGFGRRYQVTSTCTGLTNGALSLPSGSFGCTPGYASQDQFDPNDINTAQGVQPTGSVLGTAGPAVATNKIIYQSETAGSGRILRAFYSLPPFATGGAAPFTGFQAIPLTQASGTYSGQVTLTIAQF